MTDNESKKHPLTVLTPDHDAQSDLFPESLVKEMLDVERKRIESMDKKTETARMFIEASDASDKRQFEYQMARLKSDDADKQSKHRLGRAVILAGGGAFIIGLVVLISMMFWGNAAQSSLATSIFEKLFIGVGGYGVFTGVGAMVKKLIGERTKL